MKNIEIRDFQPEDLENYVKASEAFYQSKAVIHPVPKENFVRTFEKCIEKSPFLRGLVITLDGAFAGYLILNYTWANEVGGIVIFAEELYILPEYQGHGLGHAALQFIEDERSDEVKRIRLEVTNVNTGAIRLYENIGYEVLDYLQMIKDFPKK
ncbi:GNAT family N-acetyltransferase [Lachnospiraceae bacterium OttesenSCG-928-E19]|nr:GNAT family N-acetyltransferase [Lachnospiraceae bacterium OttesenSCG-928-E19]